jgi:hypothetical protein
MQANNDSNKMFSMQDDLLQGQRDVNAKVKTKHPLLELRSSLISFLA